MIRRCQNFEFEGGPWETYKDEPGTWVGVKKATFGMSSGGFVARYFEIATEGYTSFERHRHPHFVIVVRGEGRVRQGDEWSEIGMNDIVQVDSCVPHQFHNPNKEPFGILCVVDRERDKPEILEGDAPEK